MPDNLPIPVTTGEAAAAYQTISVFLTQTAAVTRSPGATFSPQATPQPSFTPEPQNTSQSINLTETPAASPSPTPPCDIAAAGNPIDVSIPDDSKIGPGESFVKTWRLVNAGSCTWTKEYGLVYFSGVDMGFRREDLFRAEVQPGGSLDISMDMVAPREAGSYQGNYKLRGKEGRLFGIGPEGGSPFWVRIVVVVEATATPTQVAPTLTPTPEVLIAGNAQLALNQSFDLDLAVPGPGPGDDFALLRDGDGFDWAPTNGARVVLHGATEPGVEACKSAATSAEPLVLGAELEGSYLCVRTDSGLPAQIYLTRVDLTVPSLDIQFVVWAAP